MNDTLKKQYFLARFTESEKDNIAMNIIINIFSYLVWQDIVEKGYLTIN